MDSSHYATKLMLPLLILQVSSFHFFLVEANLMKASGLLKVTLKCENSGQSGAFMKHFRESLVGKWIAQNPLELS